MPYPGEGGGAASTPRGAASRPRGAYQSEAGCKCEKRKTRNMQQNDSHSKRRYCIELLCCTVGHAECTIKIVVTVVE